MTVSAHTPLGEFIGINHDGCLEFRGVPYAEPPIGVARFKAPEPLLPLEEPYDASYFRDSALQPSVPIFDIKDCSEDCLYLNIYTPACDQAQRPVLVWFHGGCYTAGSGTQALYNGGSLALQGDLVVVTLNFRIGALGYLYLNDLLPADSGVTTNNGLRDQIEALRWIRDNIAAFGGNPNQITLCGASSGAMSISALLASPPAQGLFHRAILQSGAADQCLTRDEATEVTQRFLDAAKIDPTQPESLWQLPTKTILDAQQQCQKMVIDRGIYGQTVPQIGMSLVPMVDGDVLPTTPIAALQRGSASQLPIMVGCTRDEWNFFLHATGIENLPWHQDTSDLDKLSLIKRCEQNLPGMGEHVANLYQKLVHQTRSSASFSDIYSAFEGDRVFRIPSLRIAESHARHGNKVYLYQFNWDAGLFGACHASDLPFVFGNTETIGQVLTGGGPKAEKLSNIVQSCWIAFIRSSDPSTDRVGTWPSYADEQPQVMVFDQEVELQQDPFDSVRGLWHGIL